MANGEKASPRAQAQRNSKAPWIVAGAVVLVVAAIVAIGALGRSGPLPASGDVTNAEAKSLIQRGARIVDVRTPDEFAAGRIPGAENVPMDQVAERARSWDKAEPVLLYCATGSRSADVLQQLVQAGFQHVYNLKEGIVAWDGDVDSGSTAKSVAGLQPLPSGLPAMYEFFTDW
jgi:rhodanese-related sulfurtransferase